MSSSMSRDVAAKPGELLRSVLTTKSSVVGRLSSTLGQLVNAVSGQPPEHAVQQRADTGTQRQGQGRVPDYAKSHDRAAVRDSYTAPAGADTADEEMSLDTIRATFPPGTPGTSSILVHRSMDAVRATFPPGKRRRSCAASTTTTAVVDKVETGKSQPRARWKLESLSREHNGQWKVSAADKVGTGKSQPWTRSKLESLGR